MTARNKGLDVLRAIAVFMTFGRHMAPPDKANLPGPVYGVLRAWFKSGWAGVPLFFVLSGFLVSSLLFNEFLGTSGEIRFLRFYFRRGMKIYPAFYCLLACSLALAYADAHWLQQPILPHEPIPTRVFLSELFFLQNYFGAIWGHVWSLAIEEHFYISLGVIVYLILKLYPIVRPGVALTNRFKFIPWICVGVFAGALALRCLFVRKLHATGLPQDDPALMDARFKGGEYTHLRIDSLFFGVLLAYFAKFRPETFLKWVERNTLWLFAGGMLLISPSLVFEETDDRILTAGYTTLYLGFGGILLFTLYHPWKSYGKSVDRATDFLAYIGRNSYSIYLWHFPVMYLIGKTVSAEGKNYYVLIAVQNVAGVVVGLIMAKAVEIPVLNLRDRYFKSAKALTAGELGKMPAQ